MKLDSTFDEVDIVKKYHKYPDFKKELDEIEKGYKDKLNMSLYSSLDKVQKLKVFELKPVGQNLPFLYVQFYGFRMPTSEDDSEKLNLLFIRTLDQALRDNPKRKYLILYHHSLSDSSYPFAFLNSMYKKLPLPYYAMLERIIVLDSNIMLKSVGMFDFGRLQKLISRRIQFVDSLKKIKELDFIKSDKLLDGIPEELVKVYSNMSTKNANNSTGQTERQRQSIAIKSQVMKSCMKRDFMTIQLQDHKFSPDGYPVVIEILIETLRENPSFLKLEGIFRKSGSCEEQEQIIVELSKIIGNLPPNMQVERPKLNCTEYSGYSVAAVVKKFFTKLLTPIFPYQLYSKILKAEAISSQLEVPFIQDIISQLPRMNRKVLLYVTSFIKYQVIPLQEDNKMNNYNMSVVFCPCFFRSQNPGLEDLMNSGKFAGILNVLFNRYDEVIGQHKISSSISTSPERKRTSKNRGSRGSRGSKRGSKGQV